MPEGRHAAFVVPVPPEGVVGGLAGGGAVEVACCSELGLAWSCSGVRVGSRRVLGWVIEVVIEAIAKEGLSKDISIYVAKKVDKREVSKMLVNKSIEKLREKELVLGDFEGGIKVKLRDKEITIDISDQAIKEMVARFVREDFRRLVLGEK